VTDGEDPLDDADKDKITKEAKYLALTRCFWAPELAADYKEMKEKEAAAEAEAMENTEAMDGMDQEPDIGKGGRGSALGSTKSKA
jgi:hypothetical protein